MPEIAYGPAPIEIRPITLVLGPGMARGFAYVGAIRELANAKIPIGAIVGVEMGALIGSLYGIDSGINGFEWRLMKFKESTFAQSMKQSVSLFDSRESKLEEAISQVFGSKDLKDSKIPTWIGLEKSKDQSLTLVNQGQLAQLLRAALAVPGVYGAIEWNGEPALASVRGSPITQAKSLTGGPILVLDVLGQPASGSADEVKMSALMRKSAASIERDLAAADLVIRLDMSGIGYFDYKKRTEASFRGKRAISAKIAEIRHLVGLPAEPVE